MVKEQLEGWMITIAFDVDGTLIDYKGLPKKKMVDLAQALLKADGVRVFFWSGGGLDYAKMIVRRLGLPEDRVVMKASFKPDIAVDDMPVSLGDTNLQVDNK